MKKVIFLSILFLMALKVFSQELTFNDLKYLLEHDIEAADSYITTKGYRYHEAQKGKNGSCDAMFWSYGRNITDNAAIAIIAKTCFDAYEGFIWCQFNDNVTIEKIKNYCKSIDFKLIKTEIDDFGGLETFYENPKYEIKFGSGLHTRSNLNIYFITLNLKYSVRNQIKR